MKRAAAVIIAMIILVNAFAVYGKGPEETAGKAQVNAGPELSGKTVGQLMKEVDLLLYYTTPVRESEEKALVVLDQIIKLDPKCKQAYSYKAYALNNLGRAIEALGVYDKAMTAMPGDLELLYWKSGQLMKLKRYKEAIACYDKLLNSKNAEFLRLYSDTILRDKAEALCSLKRYGDAVKVYDRLIAGSGYYYSFDDGMKKGMALMELKKYKDAVKWFSEFKRHIVLDNTDQLGKVYYYSACAYSMLSNIPQAMVELEAAIKFDKSNKDKAKTDKYFKNISKDKRFINVVVFEENLLKQLKLGDGFYMIDHLTYDLNGDKVADEVALVGREILNSEFNAEHIALAIIDNKTGKLTLLTPKYTEGSIFANVKSYLYPYDLNGDGVKDITVKLGGGRYGGYTSCSYSFRDNKPVMIFGGEPISEGLSFTAKRTDTNTALLQCVEFDKALTVNLAVAERDKGRLEEPGSVGRFWNIEYVDVDGDKIYELKGYQGVSGFGGLYGFGNVISTLKYDKVKAAWIIMNVEYKWGR